MIDFNLSEDEQERYEDLFSQFPQLRDIDDINAADENGNTLLHALTLYDRYPILVYYAIKMGANPNAQNKDGETPLFLSCYTSSNRGFYHIFGAGGDPSIKNNEGKTCIDAYRKSILWDEKEDSEEEVEENLRSDIPHVLMLNKTLNQLREKYNLSIPFYSYSGVEEFFAKVDELGIANEIDWVDLFFLSIRIDSIAMVINIYERYPEVYHKTDSRGRTVKEYAEDSYGYFGCRYVLETFDVVEGTIPAENTYLEHSPRCNDTLYRVISIIREGMRDTVRMPFEDYGTLKFLDWILKQRLHVVMDVTYQEVGYYILKAIELNRLPAVMKILEDEMISITEPYIYQGLSAEQRLKAVQGVDTVLDFLLYENDPLEIISIFKDFIKFEINEHGFSPINNIASKDKSDFEDEKYTEEYFDKLVSFFTVDQIEAITPSGYNAVHQAAQEKNIGLLKAFKKYGVDLNIQSAEPEQNDSFSNPLPRFRTAADILCGLYSLDEKDIKGILELGVDTSIQDSLGNTPLHYLCERYASQRNIAPFMSYFKDLNICNNKGLTPLMVCVKNDLDGFSTEALIKAGADVTIADREGNTALHIVSKGQYQDDRKTFKKVLMFSKSIVNKVNNYGCTPLNELLHENNAKTDNNRMKVREKAALLIRSGADIKIPDNEGVTSEYLLIERGLPELVR